LKNFHPYYCTDKNSLYLCTRFEREADSWKGVQKGLSESLKKDRKKFGDKESVIVSLRPAGGE